MIVAREALFAVMGILLAVTLVRLKAAPGGAPLALARGGAAALSLARKHRR